MVSGAWGPGLAAPRCCAGFCSHSGALAPVWPPTDGNGGGSPPGRPPGPSLASGGRPRGWLGFPVVSHWRFWVLSHVRVFSPVCDRRKGRQFSEGLCSLPPGQTFFLCCQLICLALTSAAPVISSGNGRLQSGSGNMFLNYMLLSNRRVWS